MTTVPAFLFPPPLDLASCVTQCWQHKYTPSIFGVLGLSKTSDDKRKQQRQTGVGMPLPSLSQMFNMAGYGYAAPCHRFSTDDRTLMFRNGCLLSGTLESLVQHLMPTADYCPDRTYVFALLLSSRLFIRPHHLFAQVCQLSSGSSSPLASSPDSLKRQSLSKMNGHLVNLIGQWTELFPYDFRDDRMMTQLRDVTHRVMMSYPEMKKDISSIMHMLLSKLSRQETYEASLCRLSAEQMQKSLNQSLPSSAQTGILEVCPNPEVLAEQLTHIELERLSMIGPEEFIQAFCKEKKDSDASYQEAKRPHNLEAYVQWFNHLSSLVASQICLHTKRKGRVQVLEYFTDVAKACINMGNFNSLMAIIAGMNMNPVARLKKTWGKVNRAKLDIVEQLMDPSNNFGTYRSCLKAALWRSRSATNEREKVVVPFFTIFIKDLYFLNEGCSSRHLEGNINFEKCWLLARHVSQLMAWQQVECPYAKNNRVMNYVQTFPIFSEATLSLASYECESPGSHTDRERHRQLKTRNSL